MAPPNHLVYTMKRSASPSVDSDGSSNLKKKKSPNQDKEMNEPPHINRAHELRKLVDSANAPSKFKGFVSPVAFHFYLAVMDPKMSRILSYHPEPEPSPCKNNNTGSKLDTNSRFLIQTVFGIDAIGNVNEWNYKTAEITGYSREEAYNQPLVANFIAPGFRDSVQEVLDKALKGIETANYELEFHTKSKETRFLLVNASTRRDVDNNIVGGK